MALEAVVFQQDFFGYNPKDLYSLLGSGPGNWMTYDYDLEAPNKDEDRSAAESFLHHGDHWSSSSPPPPSTVPPPHHHFGTTMTPTELEVLHHPNSSSDVTNIGSDVPPPQLDTLTTTAATTTTIAARPKRRRSKSRKNKEEIENQRMTHIAVERNRRKQMNEYLSVLRSLMPDSYVQRGDQASIIGGAINFVKELEHRLQLLSAHKETKENSDDGCDGGGASASAAPFGEFFTFPQYSTSSTTRGGDASLSSMNETMSGDNHHHHQPAAAAMADIEVTMVESHANLKIRSKKRPAQLYKIVTGLNTMRLTILHLNVATVDQNVLYSLSVKVEDDCKLTSVDDIATAVYQLLGRIQEEAMLN